MILKLLTEHNLEFLSLKGGYRGSSESTHVKMPYCWKSHGLAHLSKQRKNPLVHKGFQSGCTYEECDQTRKRTCINGLNSFNISLGSKAWWSSLSNHLIVLRKVKILLVSFTAY